MPEHVTSSDGTTIAFDRFGEGPPVLIVSGLFCDRHRTHDLAAQLAAQLAGRGSVVNYDRRGRGDSSDTAPYAVEREVEDLGALISAVGGAAAVYGHSSGAGLALQAAARALPITRLVLHEPPYGPDDDVSTDAARALARRVGAAIAEDRRGDAIALFMAEAGAPAEVAEQMRGDPALLAIAPTMPYDLRVMGDGDRGGTIPVELARAVTVPTLVIAGGASPDFFRSTATRLVALLPQGALRVLDGLDHDAPAEAVAPVVAEYLLAP